jgi:hypothetical protein
MNTKKQFVDPFEKIAMKSLDGCCWASNPQTRNIELKRGEF